MANEKKKTTSLSKRIEAIKADVSAKIAELKAPEKTVIDKKAGIHVTTKDHELITSMQHAVVLLAEAQAHLANA
jgi:hypothetical protein